MKQGKIWGYTEPLLITPYYELHRITVTPLSRCSKHRHAMKHNAFYCIEGSISIKIWKESGIDTTVLNPGQITSVAPGLYHCFVGMDNYAKVLEIYWAELDGEDIDRESYGKAGKKQ